MRNSVVVWAPRATKYHHKRTGLALLRQGRGRILATPGQHSDSTGAAFLPRRVSAALPGRRIGCKNAVPWEPKPRGYMELARRRHAKLVPCLWKSR